MPEISIVVPVYNVEKYLPQCLDSLLAQSFGDIEVIAVDDGSTDGSGRICDAYAKADGRVKVLHQKNTGVSAARNAGLRIASGNWITFVDGDDWAEPVMCEAAHRTAIQTGADLVFWGNFYNFPDKEIKWAALDGGIRLFSGEQITGLQKMVVDRGAIKKETFRTMSYPWGMLWKKSVLQEKPGEPYFNEDLKWGEDQLFNIRMLGRISKAAYICDALYHYRIRSESVTNAFRADRPQMLNSYLAALDRYLLTNKADDKSFREAYYKRVFNTLIRIIRTHYCSKDYGKGLFGRARDLKQYMEAEPILTALNSLDPRFFPFQRRVILRLARMRLYILIILLFNFKYVLTLFNRLRRNRGRINTVQDCKELKE